MERQERTKKVGSREHELRNVDEDDEEREIARVTSRSAKCGRPVLFYFPSTFHHVTSHSAKCGRPILFHFPTIFHQVRSRSATCGRPPLSHNSPPDDHPFPSYHYKKHIFLFRTMHHRNFSTKQYTNKLLLTNIHYNFTSVKPPR